jgi:preprotein translocase subunit SecA
MADLRGSFTEQFLKVQVSAAPSPPRPQSRTFSGPVAPGAETARRTDGPTARRTDGQTDRSGVSDMVTSDRGPVGGGSLSVRPSVRPSVSGGGGLPIGWATTGRNDPCPCGSGKKFKKCHGTNL